MDNFPAYKLAIEQLGEELSFSNTKVIWLPPNATLVH
jgi:hypothetical protein